MALPGCEVACIIESLFEPLNNSQYTSGETVSAVKLSHCLGGGET